MDPPHIKSSCGTQKKNSNPMGTRLGIDYVTWRNLPKWIPPTSNLHLGYKKKSNPMGIGLGIDYVTWRNLQKWIPPTSNLHVGHKMKSPILWGGELIMSHGRISKNVSPPHEIFM